GAHQRGAVPNGAARRAPRALGRGGIPLLVAGSAMAGATSTRQRGSGRGGGRTHRRERDVAAPTAPGLLADRAALATRGGGGVRRRSVGEMVRRDGVVRGRDRRVDVGNGATPPGGS